MTRSYTLFNQDPINVPYIIPIIDLETAKLNAIIKKIEQFNDIIQLISQSMPIYNTHNFIRNIENPHLHRSLRKDVITTLQIIFDNPEKIWTHPNTEVIATIDAIKNYFIPFRATKALLFESTCGQFDWQQIMQDKSTVPFYFFECMHLFFGIQCYIPNTGSILNKESLLTANLTNHGEHFSIGTHYLLTPSDGNCFFHLHCQLLGSICIKHQTLQSKQTHLLDLCHTYAINKKNDQLLRFFYKMQTKAQLQKLLKTLFEDQYKDFQTLKKPGMLDLSAHLVTDFFKVNIREHHVNTSGETFLKKNHGPQNTDWFIDIFVSNDETYVSNEILGKWHIVNSYEDYLDAIALLWDSTIQYTHHLRPTQSM